MKPLDLVARNRAESLPDLPTSPGIPAVIVSCVDARTDPAILFGLEPGEASVMRTVGGRVTKEVAGQLGMIAGLAAALMGADMQLDVAVIHHTECGASRFTMPPVQDAIVAAAGLDVDVVSELAIADPIDSVREDIGKLADSALPRALIATGYVYDVTTGRLEVVVQRGTLADHASS